MSLQRASAGVVESLESRRLLATISGNVFADLNFTQLRESKEPGGQALIYIDRGIVGRHDAADLTATIAADGSYSFTNLAAGTHAVRVEPPAGSVVTTRSSSSAPFSVDIHLASADQTLLFEPVGIAPRPASNSIHGYVYRDENQNGRLDTGDLLDRLATAFLDLNNNAVREQTEPTAVVDSLGNFSFPSPGAVTGNYTVRLITHYKVTTPATQKQTVYLFNQAGVTGVSFGVQKGASGISGPLYRDDNLNGLRDAGELSIFSGAVYLDLNNNGQREDTEPLSQNLDATYFFNGLTPGTYTLRALGGNEYLPTNGGAVTVQYAGQPVTQPIGFVLRNASQAFIGGSLYDDANLSGTRDAGEGSFTSYGNAVYLDLNNNGAPDSGEPSSYTGGTGTFAFYNVAPGTYSLRVTDSYGVRVTDPASGARTVTVAAGDIRNVELGVVQTYSLFVRVVNDTNGNGAVETGEVGVAGRTVWADLDDDGTPDANEPSATTGTGGTATIEHVLSGSFRLRTLMPAGWSQTGRSATVTAATVAPTFASTGMVTLPHNFTSPNIREFAFATHQTTSAPSPITLQAEAGLLSGGTAKGTSHAGYSGTGYADYGGSGSAVQWTFNWTSAGQATLDFRYANGSTSNRPLSVQVNGVTVGTIACAPTGGWATWKSVTLDVALKAGSNTIKAIAGAVGGANVDQMAVAPADGTVTPPPPPPPPPDEDPAAVTLQAETATLSGGTVKATNHAGYTGTGFADYAGTGSSVQWTVSWPTAGSARLDFRYANGSTGNRPLSVVVNGVTVGSIACAPTGGWTSWKTVSLAVALKAGSNVIKAVAGAVGGANVDALTIAPSDGTVIPPPPPPPPPTGSLGSISGVLFWDSDKDGRRDSGEVGQGGKVVFLDLDGDNVLDSNERRMTTDASGNFKFDSLAAGTYKVRRVLPKGYVVTTSPLDITLSAGQVFSGALIGTASA